jgi:hypothetical protein
MDSLEPNDDLPFNRHHLQLVSGHHHWIHPDDGYRIERSQPVNSLLHSYHGEDDQESLQQKTFSMTDLIRQAKKSISNEDNETDEYSLTQMDISLSRFDAQLQVSQSQMEETTHYGVFTLPSMPTTVQGRSNHNTETSEMDTEQAGGHSKRTAANGFSTSPNSHERDERFSRRNRQTNGSSGSSSSSGGDGFNPNRNNNNSRRLDSLLQIESDHI